MLRFNTIARQRFFSTSPNKTSEFTAKGLAIWAGITIPIAFGIMGKDLIEGNPFHPHSEESKKSLIQPK